MTLRHICNDRCDGDAHDTKPKRLRDDIRILPSAALTVTLIALVAFVVQYHRAAMWACVVALVLAVGGLFTLAMEALDLRAELAAERDAREETAQQLLAQREADAMAAQLKPTVVDGFGNVRPGSPRPDLSIVPTQRDAEHDRLAMSAEEWAAIERETREL